MPTFHSNGALLHYEDSGDGRPVVFLHGCWMSSRFFTHQTAPGALPGCRVIAPDFRGHGRSEKTLDGHTMAAYADDVRNLIETLDLHDVTLVGWSMGAFVAWEYLTAHTDDRVSRLVVIEESVSDYSWPDWHLGAIDATAIAELSSGLQTDQRSVAAHFASAMFASPLDPQEMEWMVEEICAVPPVIASTVLLQQTLVDYRETVKQFTVPSLVCFGKDEILLSLAAGQDLAERLPDAELLVFERSSHCPFIEESERLNQAITRFATTSSREAVR